MLSIDPQKAVALVLEGLPKRSGAVLEKRFGLSKANGKRLTLEAIGKTYNITRERVRQIERDSFARIKKGPAYAQVEPVLAALEQYIGDKGHVAPEASIIEHFNTDGASGNHIRFLLTLAPTIHHRGEDTNFNHRWCTDDNLLQSVERALKSSYGELKKNDKVFTRNEMSDFLLGHMRNQGVDIATVSVLDSYIGIAKGIGTNSFDQWGHADSPLIRPRGMRDMAYLIFKKETQPLHFLETAERIRDLITKKRVHAQTVHNELIKDARFVLVGRGTYGLAEWGYEPGTVRDIITRVLNGSVLGKDQIVQQVLEKRKVKANTVLINLQNKKFFKKLPDGTYTTVV